MNENKKPRTLFNIPRPELPVLFISAAGDQEGRSSIPLGFFNGETESVLREVAPKANRKEPSYKADYEVEVIYHAPGQIQEILKHLELWKGYADTEVKYIPFSSSANFRVLVHMWKNAIDEFLQSLKPETKYERKKGFFSPDDEFILIEL